MGLGSGIVFNLCMHNPVRATPLNIHGEVR